MDYYSMTDEAIALELGSRIRQLRLRQNLTQKQLGLDCNLSINTVKRAELGLGKFINIIALMRALSMLDELDGFLPKPQISPMELLKNRDKSRKRAHGTKRDSRLTTSHDDRNTEW